MYFISFEKNMTTLEPKIFSSWINFKNVYAFFFSFYASKPDKMQLCRGRKIRNHIDYNQGGRYEFEIGVACSI